MIMAGMIFINLFSPPLLELLIRSATCNFNKCMITLTVDRVNCCKSIKKRYQQQGMNQPF